MDDMKAIIADAILVAGLRRPVRTEIVLRTPFFSLLRCAAGAGPRPVLVVEPLSGIRAPMLYDMLTDLAAHADVYVLIWRDAEAIPVSAGEFGLEANIDAVLRAVAQLGTGLHVVGLCQSALPVLAAVAVLCASEKTPRPASMALLGGKLDTRIAPTRADRLTRGLPLAWFANCVVSIVPWYCAGAGRLVYGTAMQSVVLLSLLGRHALSGGEVFRKMLLDDGEDRVGHPFGALLMSPVAIPGEFFLETIDAVYHRSLLAEGRLLWHGARIDCGRISDVWLLTVEAEADDIAGRGQTEVAHALCRGIPAAMRRHHLQPGIGHFGLFHGGVWRDAMLRRLLAFFRDAEARPLGLDPCHAETAAESV